MVRTPGGIQDRTHRWIPGAHLLGWVGSMVGKQMGQQIISKQVVNSQHPPCHVQPAHPQQAHGLYFRKLEMNWTLLGSPLKEKTLIDETPKYFLLSHYHSNTLGSFVPPPLYIPWTPAFYKATIHIVLSDLRLHQRTDGVLAAGSGA